MTENRSHTPAGPPEGGAKRHPAFSADRRRQRLKGIVALATFVLSVLIAATAAFGMPSDAMRVLPGADDPLAKQGGRDGARTDASSKDETDASAPPENPTMYLSVPRLGIERDTVRNDDSEKALSRGAIKVPGSGFPWEKGANTYVACHRIGFAGTESFEQCLDLPSMKKGDKIKLEDSDGETYRYEVTESLTVLPHETWVADPVPGRRVLSLQTCIEAPGDLATLGPDWAARYVVRADLVEGPVGGEGAGVSGR